MLDPVGTAPGPRRAAAPTGDGPDRGRPARAAARAPADVGDGASRPRRSRPRSPAPPTYRRRDRAPVRDPRVGDRQHPARRRGRRGWSSSRWRSPPACGAARSRSPPASSRRPRPTTTRCWSSSRARHARHAVLRGRLDDRRAGGRAAGGPTRWPWPSRAPGGLLAARLTDRAGSSAYFLGGGGRLLQRGQGRRWSGVDPELIERFGAVSTEVAEALADGRDGAFGAEIGVGITGIAGPGRRHRGEAGRARVLLGVRRATGGGSRAAPQLPGGRADVRDRSMTVAMHLLRRLLLGEGDRTLPGGGSASRASGARAVVTRRAGAAVRRARAAGVGSRARWSSGARACSAGVRGLRPRRPRGVAARDAVLPGLALPVAEVEAIAAACDVAAAAAAVELSLGEPLWLPPRRPRVLAVERRGRRGAAWPQLQAALAEALAARRLVSSPSAGRSWLTSPWRVRARGARAGRPSCLRLPSWRSRAPR